MSATQKDIGAFLREVNTAPTAAAAGTVSSTAFKLDGAASGYLGVATGAATGTPTTISVTAKLMVAADNGSGAPGSFALYTGPDGVDAQVVLTAAASSGKVAIKLEGTAVKIWGRVDVVTAFTGGSSPTVASQAHFVFNDSQAPARAVVYAS